MNGRYFKILGRRRADVFKSMPQSELAKVVEVAEIFACDAKVAIYKAKNESYIRDKFHQDALIARAV